MKFLQTVLIIILFIMAIRLLWRAFGPAILRWAGRKAMEKVQRSFEKRTGYQSAQQQKGQTTVESKGSSRSARGRKTVGEYVDFEEID